MKKPEELTEEQWVNYTGHIAFALERMNKGLDLIAEANFQTGEQVERDRIIKLLEEWFEVDADLSSGIEPLIKLIKGEQPHPPQQFRDTANGE